MADRVNFTLQGVAELKEALANLSEEVATRLGRRANNLAARVVANAIKEGAPVSDIPSGTQRTRRNKRGDVVKYEHRKIKDEVRVRARRARKENTVLTHVTSGRAFHAHMVEHGTSRAPAHPFWRPAVDQAAGAAAQAQVDELKKGIEREAKRRARKK